MINIHSSRLLFNNIRTISFSSQRFLSSDQKQVPKNAEIVIAGGGLIGNSVAYHLTKCGWKDILLLEQGQAGCGTSWHGAGLCGSVKGSKTQVDMALYGIDLYSTFERETDVSSGFKRCGSLYLASTKEREIALKRSAAFSRQYGVECHVISPKEAKDLNPLLNVDDVRMALYAPQDGVVNPTDLIQAYLKGSTKSGSTNFMEGVTVNGFENSQTRVTGVHTSHGFVSCDKFINCTGLWARDLGLKSNPRVEIPLHACEHFLIITKAMENIDPLLPVTRDYDGYTYIREWSGGLLAGGFEPNARGTFFKEIPKNFEFQLLEEDWDHFGLLMDGLLHRFPCFENAEIRQFTNGPESFTADGYPHVSQSDVFSNYYIAAGLNSNGIVNSAGVGKSMAELITYGESEININNFNLQRIFSSSNNKLICHDKAASTLAIQYALNFPRMESRDKSIKNSPIHYLLDKSGAVWANSADWAKPYYFKMTDTETHVNSFGKPSWLPNVQFELQNCGENVNLFDFSSKSKFSVKFKTHSLLNSFIQSICINKDDVKYNDVISTVVPSPQGTAVCTVDIILDNEDGVTLITDAQQHTLLLSHINELLNEYSDEVSVEDASGKYAIFGLVGSGANDVISDLLSPPFSTASISQGEVDEVELGYASNVKLSHYFMQGIDGWQIVVPTEYSQGLYSMLMETGDKYGIKNGGSFALDSLRVEHMVPSYGSEFGFGTDVSILAYLNKSSAEKQSDISLMKLEINVSNSDNWPWGGEQIAVDGRIVGNVATIGYTEKNDVVNGLSFLDKNHVTLGEHVDVIVGEDQYKGKIVQMK